MLTTITEAVTYIQESLKNIAPEEEVDELILRDIIEERLYEKLEPEMKEDDFRELTDHVDDDEYVDSYLQTKIPHFYTKLEETVVELLAEYIMPEQDEASA
jgi:hypothetical protein